MADDVFFDTFCRQTLPSRSRFSGLGGRQCHFGKDHSGKCMEFPFLVHLGKVAPRVADKIERDSTHTTGAAWKSEEAGPNRILRWVMLASDEDLLAHGINMANLKPQVIAKLREKAADYDSCVRVAMWLAYSCYQMPDAPECTPEIKEYLESKFGPMQFGTTTCAICLIPISFKLFDEARRGKATIETCHKDPRFHAPGNVGFAHRDCNIAQGAKTLDEFYDWITGIVKRARPEIIS